MSIISRKERSCIRWVKTTRESREICMTMPFRCRLTLGPQDSKNLNLSLSRKNICNKESVPSAENSPVIRILWPLKKSVTKSKILFSKCMLLSNVWMMTCELSMISKRSAFVSSWAECSNGSKTGSWSNSF